jgi:hypothetical protein
MGKSLKMHDFGPGFAIAPHAWRVLDSSTGLRHFSGFSA